MKNILIRVAARDLRRAALWAMLAMVSFSSGSAWAGEPAWWTKQKRDCGLPSGLAYNNWNGECRSGTNNRSAPAIDYEAERRQQEAAAAEAAAEAERQRQAEAQRIKEAAEKQAAFIRSRDDAANTLKGSIGTTVSPNNGGLKGSNDYGLKDAVSDHGLKGSTTPSSGQSKQAAAWKQLHCAASIAGYALSALQTKGDYNEFGTLSIEALKALDGQRPSVECGNAPPFPDARGKAVDMERVKATERQVLERAASIAERMKQRQAGAKPALAAAPTGPETPDEKMRRVQKELDRVNSEKITGKTQKEIDQQEKDRKKLAKLVLVNNGLAKGDFSSVGADLSEEKPRRSRAEKREPPPPAKP